MILKYLRLFAKVTVMRNKVNLRIGNITYSK